MHRRESLKLLGSGIAGLGTGILFLNGSNRAKATVEMNSFSISDASTTTRDGTISDVQIAVNGSWEYSVPNEKDPESWTCTLEIVRGEESATIGQASGNAMYLSSNGEISLSGSVLDTDLYAVGDFEEGTKGETKETNLTFRIVFEVAGSSDELLAKATQEATGTVGITNEAYSPEEYGGIELTGNVSLKE